MVETFRDLINQGVLAASAGQREQAERCFKQAVEHNPQDARGWYYYALAVTDPDEARRALARVLQIDPDHQPARRRLDAAPPPEDQTAWNKELVLLPRESKPEHKPSPFPLIPYKPARFIIVLLIGLVLFLVGYWTLTTQEMDPAIKAVIDAYVRAMQNEDLDALLATVHPDAVEYDLNQRVTAQAFALYDVDYTIEKLEMIRHNKDTAQVRIVLVTRGRSSPDYKDNRVTAVIELRRYQKDWRVYEWQSEEIDYLN